MAENADNDSLSPLRVARRAPSKRRASSASSDGENTLAGAAQSAPPFGQQSVQPGEPLRDESTLDLFAGDPLHAPVQSTQTGHRQGRFELPEASTAEAAQVAGTSTEPAVAVSHDGAQAEAAVDPAPREEANGGVASEIARTPEAAATVPAADSERTVAAIASHTAVLAEANGAAEDAASPQVDEAATDPMLPGQALAQLRAARAVAAPRPAKSGRAVSRAAAAGSVAAGDASSAEAGQPGEPMNASRADALPARGHPASESHDAGDFARAAGAARAEPVLPAPPEPNPARAAALAEAIDALNGVIADQRRAAGRMKWMLGAAVGALLATVVAGAAQTMILSRLATDVGDQQQRIAQLMQDQQAAIASALARLPSPTEAPAGQAASQSPVHPAATSPAHHPRHGATHGHHTRAASQ
jgi:outer membrane murein-binding lipoprotein Lpp